MKQLKARLLAVLAVPALMLGVLAIPATVGAIGITSGAESAKGDDQTACLFGTEGPACEGKTPTFRVITNVLLFIIGAVSVIMLIIGGIRYTVSGGDSAAVKGAKDTILYAIVGIIVAILAFAVVNFVIGNFAGGDAAV